MHKRVKGVEHIPVPPIAPPGGPPVAGPPGELPPWGPPTGETPEESPPGRPPGRPPRPPRPPGRPPRPPRPPGRPPVIMPSPPNQIIVYPIIKPIIQYPNPGRTSYIRFVNAAPDPAEVDIYIDGTQVASQLAYQQESAYTIITSPGMHNITVYRARTKGNPVISVNVNLSRDVVYTGAVTGYSPGLWLQITTVPRVEVPTGVGILRFNNLSPNSPALTVQLSDGATLFNCVAYGNVGQFIGVRSNSYTINITPCGSNTPLVTLYNVYIGEGAFTLYAMGYLDGNPPLILKLIKD